MPTSGTVSFFDGGQLIGTAQNVGGHGVATITTTSLTAGSHVITAMFSGDTALLRRQPVGYPRHQLSSGPGSTGVQLASSPNPGGNGFPVTFTATVTAQAPSVVNPSGGTVQFYDGVVTNPANLLGAVTNNGTGNVFTFITTALVLERQSAHHHRGLRHEAQLPDQCVQSAYAKNHQEPDDHDHALDQQSPVFGQPVTYTVHLTDTPPSTFIPAGTVSLSVDGIAAAPSTPNPATLDATGTATFTGIRSAASARIRSPSSSLLPTRSLRRTTPRSRKPWARQTPSPTVSAHPVNRGLWTTADVYGHRPGRQSEPWRRRR